MIHFELFLVRRSAPSLAYSPLICNFATHFVVVGTEPHQLVLLYNDVTTMVLVAAEVCARSQDLYASFSACSTSCISHLLAAQREAVYVFSMLEIDGNGKPCHDTALR